MRPRRNVLLNEQERPLYCNGTSLLRDPVHAAARREREEATRARIWAEAAARGIDLTDTCPRRPRLASGDARRRALAWLAEYGPARPIDVARSIDVSSGHVVRVLKRPLFGRLTDGRWFVTKAGLEALGDRS